MRASFCVSNVGIIVSSSAETLGFGPAVGASVCACASSDSANINKAINSPTIFIENVILSEVKNL